MSVAPPLFALAHAKLNLTLRVLAREASGYHQIETLFCLLELADELEVELCGAGVHLEIVAPPEAGAGAQDLGPATRNLAARAAAAFREHTGIRTGVSIRLTKRIPAGAGLGGGSSDAAAVLVALNRLTGETVDLAALMALGGRLGSDVPFFVARAPLALAWGRGTRIAPLVPPPSAPVVLAVPATPVATAAAYEALASTRADTFAAEPALIDASPRSWAELDRAAHNDFEEVIFRRLPLLRSLRDQLSARGAHLARMTGTGSTIFGVFAEVSAAGHAAAQLRAQFPDVRFIETRTIAG